MWSNGDQIVFRFRDHDGRISVAEAMTVVQDSADFIALYLAADTPMKKPVAIGGKPIPRSTPYEERFAQPWELGDSLWTDNATLWLARPDDEHCVLLFWRASDWTFLGWYINLQAPLKRTSVGFESEDHILDILVHPDLTWEWKDEDEFAAAQRVERFTEAQAAAVRAAGWRAIAQVDARARPYSEDWEHWRPDPSWRIPPLPSDWHKD